MLHVHYSNRLENLADQLSSVISHPIASPFAPENVVVQSEGMARWLAMRLAERLGVCANVRFPFPARFVWEIFRLMLPDVPRASPFEPAVMVWRIMRLLDDVVGLAEFKPVQEYLSDGDDLKRYQLACSIAEMFDRHLVYRPEWIRRWEAGKEKHWQAELWRRLVKQDEGTHWVHIQDAFLTMLPKESTGIGELPARTCLFGISALSPSYLQVLARLAEVTEVHLFVLNPCRRYWGEIVSYREKVRRSGQEDPETLYLEIGNSLLASLGRQGRDFIDMLLDYSHHEHEAFEAFGEDSVLHVLQTDVLDLREPGTDERPLALFDSDDRSVQVHVCHSALREVEILHDQLLALFESNPDVDPSDVIVMTPDLNAYAPYIEAVFSTADEGCRIPFNICDRGVHAQRVLVDVFFDILELVGSRLEAPKVLGLLESTAVRKRFGFDDDDVVRIHEWVRSTGVRWGADARAKAAQGLPSTSEHTWRFGLDRLLAGYALSDANMRLFDGIAPYEHVEGGEAQVMGRLQVFVEEVIGLQKRVGGRRTVFEWSDTLLDVLGRFLEPSAEEEVAVHSIRQVIDSVRQDTERAGYAKVISLDVVKDHLRRELDACSSRGSFLTGAVTCTAMIPMRSIPFEVVCLIGMNDGSYPRAHRSPGFDLMSHKHRRGDRSRRDEDRYMFLETLLSARRVLYLSHVGRNIRDDTVLPPSALVSELFDYLRCAFRTDDGTDILSHIVTQHPLQPYSSQYFSDEVRLFSYSRAMCAAGQAGSPGESNPFIIGELPEAEPERRTIDLGQLVRFFSNPTRFLLQLRLGIYLGEGGVRLHSREPFSVDPLERWQLRKQLLDLKVAGETNDGLLPFARARGMLPHGQVGNCVFNESLTSVERFVERIDKVGQADTFEPLEVDLSFDDLRLTGRLPAIGREGSFTYDLGWVTPKRRLRLWIEHLVLNALRPPNTRTASRWLGEHEDVVLNPMSNAETYLCQLLQLYWRGLHRPLHFFPTSSFTYAKAKFKCKDDPLEAACAKWVGSDYAARGERDDVYYQLAYRGSDPLDDEFVELAVAVCTPMFEHANELV